MGFDVTGHILLCNNKNVLRSVSSESGKKNEKKGSEMNLVEKITAVAYP